MTRDNSTVTGDTLHITSHPSRVAQYKIPATNYLFKATLDIKKHHLTGLLVIKRMDTIAPPPAPPQAGRGEHSPLAFPSGGNSGCFGTYRIVFMNEIGMTFFDLELKADSLKVVSCFESLNKKALMNIFKTDFTILNWSCAVENKREYRQAETNRLVVKGDAGKYKTWQTYSPSGDTLYATTAKSNLADPVIITFAQYKDGFPVKITIENPFIGMKLVMRKLVQ
ncbi:MAG: hypothetical protein WCK09_18970 [Bacteroidota bacterium]